VAACVYGMHDALNDDFMTQKQLVNMDLEPCTEIVVICTIDSKISMAIM